MMPPFSIVWQCAAAHKQVSGGSTYVRRIWWVHALGSGVSDHLRPVLLACPCIYDDLHDNACRLSQFNKEKSQRGKSKPPRPRGGFVVDIKDPFDAPKNKRQDR